MKRKPAFFINPGSHNRVEQAVMSEERARRYAEILLRENCKERVFPVKLPGDEGFEQVARVLEQDFGCGVERDEDKCILIVYCPPRFWQAS